MRNRKHTGQLALLALLLWPPAHGRTVKGDLLIEQARREEAKSNTAGMDRALEIARQALESDPSDVEYQLEVSRIRAFASQFHVNDGHAFLKAGQLEKALSEFEKAAAIDPAPSVALQEANRLRDALTRLKTDPSRSPSELLTSPVVRADRRTSQQFSTAKAPPHLEVELKAPLPKLQVNEQLSSEVFALLGRLTGVRVVFDPDYQGQHLGNNQLLDFRGLTIDECFDYVALISKSFWRPLGKDSILVANDDPVKRAAFDEQVTRVFYMNNTQGNPAVVANVANTVQKTTDIKKLLVEPEHNAIVVRADRNRMELAEKLFGDLDKQKSELIIDVLILSVTKDWIRDLGVNLGITGDTVNIASTPRADVQGHLAGSGSGARIPLNALKRLQFGDFGITLPNVALNALLDTRGTKILDKAQLRTLEGQKSTLKIGRRVPYATGSFSPGATGGVNALVNTQFQFLDVGLSLEVLATVHEPDEVTLHIESDHSSVADYINLGGVLQPIITQRKRTADVRVKEGEVNFWDIVSQRLSFTHSTGIPGLVRVPGLGRLFRDDRREETEDQLLHLLIPHVVRKPEVTEVNLAPISSGTDQTVRISYDRPQARVSGPTNEVVSVTSTLPAQRPSAPPITSIPVAGLPPAVDPTRPASVQFRPSSLTVRAGTPFTVDIAASNVPDLRVALLALTLDGSGLNCLAVKPGPLMTAGGAAPDLMTDNGRNEMFLRLERPANAPSGPSEGVVATLDCRGLKPGRFDLTIPAPKWTDRQNREAALPPARLEVTVQ